MRCHYCNGDADVGNIEYLGNEKIAVCYKTKCQQEFLEERRKQKERSLNYDD